MARTKKTTNEQEYPNAFVETKETIEGSIEENTDTAVEVTEETYQIPDWDYQVVSVNSVTKYLYRGYTLVGGPVVRFNDLYQAVILYGTKEVSKAEYDAFREEYK